MESPRMRREALARPRRTLCGAWIPALDNERFDRRDAGVDFFEDKRALLLARAAAMPVLKALRTSFTLTIRSSASALGFVENFVFALRLCIDRLAGEHG